MIKDFAKDIKGLSDNVVAIRNIEGIVECNIENLLNQPFEGLLYDLNRDQLTNYTRLENNDERAINDIAIVKILKYVLDRSEFAKNKDL